MAVKKFYVTTPIYYANDSPHIGHVYSTIAADILNRWKKSQGYRTFFLTGTDEHGLKVQKAAEKAGKPIKEFVDEKAEDYRKLFENLNIKYDRFIRTTDLDHRKVAQAIVRKLHKSNDIYKGTYEGLYCVDCEAYYTEKDLVNGACPIHKKKVERVSEDTYFFNLSKYQDKLLKLYEQNPDLIKPETRRNEVVSKVKSELRDLSITRTNFSWGIPYPFDNKHILYVWIDALTNYLTAIDYLKSKAKFKSYWPVAEHIIGKDILWFHTAIWHSILLSTGLKPSKVFAHGWLTTKGTKISKSLGNVIDPNKLVNKYGSDALRYSLFREVAFGNDGEFSEKTLATRINNELANELGNLVSRTLTLAEKFSDSKIPKGRKNSPLATSFKRTYREADLQINNYEFHHALETIWKFIADVNRYIDSQKPWDLAKDERNKKQLNDIIYQSCESLRAISALVEPFIPESSQKIVSQLGLKTIPTLAKYKWGQLKTGTRIQKGDILFEKIDFEKAGFEDPFEKLDLKVGEVWEVKPVEGADRLYQIKVHLGKFGHRQIVAGIREHYTIAQLKGKKVVVVANLKPVKLRGVMSQGMLLAAEDKNNVGLLTVANSDLGDDVFIYGLEKKPVENLSIDEFIKITLKVKGGSVFYKDKPLQTGKEMVRVDKIKDASKVR